MNSYGQPPFVLAASERNGGLAAAFVEQLNQAVGPAIRFNLETLPRRRLELELGNRAQLGLALFLAPEFLLEPAQRVGSWSVPVMLDENLLVAMQPLKLSSLDDLRGLRLGGISGHIYRHLGPLIDSGLITRDDAVDHIGNLRKLCLGRVDFVVISRSELAGTEPHARCSQRFKSTAFPQPQVILRRVLVRMPTDESSRLVLDAIAAVACGARWTAALAQYGLSTVSCRSGQPATVTSEVSAAGLPAFPP